MGKHAGSSREHRGMVMEAATSGRFISWIICFCPYLFAFSRFPWLYHRVTYGDSRMERHVALYYFSHVIAMQIVMDNEIL